MALGRDIPASVLILAEKAEEPRNYWCPGRDLNPHSRCRNTDFKSVASADFATRALSISLQRRLPGTLHRAKFS